MGLELAGTVLAGSRQQRVQRTIRSRAAEELRQQEEKKSPSHGGRVVPGDPQERREGRCPALMQCSRGFNPTGTLHQPESRLPGAGNADATAAPWFCFVSGWILQLGDRAACAIASA